MVIVAGHLIVPANRRAEYLDACADVVQAAREAPGCLDFALSADLLQPDRVNVYECWQDAASVEAFRGSGPDDELSELITGADVSQHEVASSLRL
jgi:quinol monooxygenase YgiN